MRTPTRRGRPSSRAPVRASSVSSRPESRGLVRALVRRGSRSDHSPAVSHQRPAPRDPTVCGGCGAVFTRKTWRRSTRRRLLAYWSNAPRGLCPACRQVAAHRAFGRVRIEGSYVEGHATEIRRRIGNVADRAQHTQPERRLVEIEARGRALEVLTTSQKLAHRIGRELQKAFGGSVSYRWSDRGGELLAVWRRDEDMARRR